MLYSATAEWLATPNLIVSPDATGGSAGYSPAQIRHAYGFDQVKFGSVSGDGSGQTIAIVDAYNDPNVAADLHAFNLHFGLADPTSFRQINQTGGSNLPSTNAGWALETALDVEWAHAIAPKANLLLVEASSSSLGDLLTAVNTARNAAGVSTVSMSWGGGEFWGQTYFDSLFTTPAGHQGVTFVAASGDNGSWYGPQWPASSPNVLAVGGTTLNVTTAGGAYQSETAWSGSGGGISYLEPQPAWQNGVQSTGARTVPDVAYNANPSSGFAVYDSVPYGGSSGWQVVGGTSAGAPQWAALVAIADQGRAINHLSTLNGATQTLPALYAMSSSAFHDITQGASSYFFGAAKGYDAVTGLGSPQAQNIIAALAKTTTPVSGATFASATAKSAAALHVVRADEAPVAAAFVPPTSVQSAFEQRAASPGMVPDGAVAMAARTTPEINVAAPTPRESSLGGAPAVSSPGVAFSTVPIASVADASIGPVAALRAAVAAGGPATDAPATAGSMSVPASRDSAAVAYNLMRLDPAALFDDSTNALIRETAGVTSAGAESVRDHPWAWAVTAAVVAADGILIGRMQIARRRKSQGGSADASPFGVTLLDRESLN